MLVTEINGNQVVLWSPPNIFLEGKEPPPNILRLILVDVPYRGLARDVIGHVINRKAPSLGAT